VLGFETCEKKQCDMLLDFSQLPQLTTLRIHNLEGGLTLTGKSRLMMHLELTYSWFDGDEIFGRLSSSLESIHAVGSSMHGVLEQDISFPRLRSVEPEGNLDFLPLVLFSSTASLESVTVHYGHDRYPDALEKVLNELPPGAKPCIPVDTSRTVTLSDHDGSLALSLESGRGVYAPDVTRYDRIMMA
jgi:hypothetical protein